MDLLLILYAMIAGLAGFNAGPAALTRAPEVAQGRIIAGDVAPSSQSSVAATALASRTAAAIVWPAMPLPDARLAARTVIAIALPVVGRAAPERRLE